MTLAADASACGWPIPAGLLADFPTAWLGEVVHPLPVEPAASARELITQALAHPLGSPALEQLVWPGRKVTILIDDYSRPTPASLLLDPILQRLEAAGIPGEDICLVIAPGSHRRMTPQELQAKIGDLAALEVGRGATVAPLVHASDRQEMVDCGRTESGLAVWANRWVAEDRLRIGLGMITPHMDAGFSGGAKLILPGACALPTVDAFHALAARFPGNPLGNVDAPLRLELERFVQARLPLHFIANLVLTPDGQVCHCVAGDAVQAQRQGANLARRVYGAPVRRRYPVVAACCAPYDQDLWQSCKGLWSGELLTADGGELIWQTAATEGWGSVPLLADYLGCSLNELERVLAGGTAAREVDLKAAATALLINRMKQRLSITLVSPGFGLDEARQMGLGWAPDLGAALAAAVKRLPASQRSGSAALIPQAGTTLPVFSDGLPG